MPEVLEKAKPDALARDRAEALYMIGVQPSVISQKLGVQYDTLRQWCTRGKWKKKKDSRRDATVSLVEQQMSEQTSDFVARHQSLVTRTVEKHIDSLANISTSDPRKIGSIASALKGLDDVGRRNLGLSTESSSEGGAKTFNFNLGAAQVPLKSAQVVEVPVITESPQDGSTKPTIVTEEKSE